MSIVEASKSTWPASPSAAVGSNQTVSGTLSPEEMAPLTVVVTVAFDSSRAIATPALPSARAVPSDVACDDTLPVACTLAALPAVSVAPLATVALTVSVALVTGGERARGGAGSWSDSFLVFGASLAAAGPSGPTSMRPAAVSAAPAPTDPVALPVAPV